MTDPLLCQARVWDNGDMTSCDEPRPCRKHECRETGVWFTALPQATVETQPSPPVSEPADPVKVLHDALCWLPGIRPGDGERADAAFDALRALTSERAAHAAEVAQWKGWLDEVTAALHGWHPIERRTYVPDQLADRARDLTAEVERLRKELEEADEWRIRCMKLDSKLAEARQSRPLPDDETLALRIAHTVGTVPEDWGFESLSSKGQAYWLSLARAARKAFFSTTEPASVTPAETAPIPMVLHCPECGTRHVDEGEFATKVHHTHSCQGCGLTWRPAVVATVGVRFLPGFKNETYPAPARAHSADCNLRHDHPGECRFVMWDHYHPDDCACGHCPEHGDRRQDSPVEPDNTPPPFRPAVAWFAQEMERRLRESNEQGNCSLELLLERLGVRHGELVRLTNRCSEPEQKLAAAADLANVAMLVASICQPVVRSGDWLRSAQGCRSQHSKDSAGTTGPRGSTEQSTGTDKPEVAGSNPVGGQPAEVEASLSDQKLRSWDELAAEQAKQAPVSVAMFEALVERVAKLELDGRVAVRMIEAMPQDERGRAWVKAFFDTKARIEAEERAR